MSKKLFIIIGIILGIFLLALLGYYFILSSNDTVGTGKPFTFKNFFPFGGDSNPLPDTHATTTEDREVPNPTTGNYAKKLRLLSSEPVSGAVIIDTKVGTLVRHIEKATGHIFETELFSPNQNRISNTTIPLVYDATWTSDGRSLIAQYLKENNQTIDTYSLTLKTSTSTDNTVTGIAFPTNIVSYSLSDTNVFYLTTTAIGSQGIVTDIGGNKKREIWNSPLREILSQYVNNNTLALTTKPYAGVNGFLYFVNTTNGSIKTILQNIPGLTTLIRGDAKVVIYGINSEAAGMHIKDLEKGIDSNLSPVTFPEKCAWSKKEVTTIYCAVPEQGLNGNSLINWYMGNVSFRDNIWKYNLLDNTSQIVGKLETESNDIIDATKLLVSENDHYIIFINKINGQLWSLDLTK